MTRVMPLVFVALACALVCVPVSAEDPPKKLTPAERKQLEAEWQELMVAGLKAYQTGKHPEATKPWAEGCKLARQLYPKADFPDGHANLAISLNNLGLLYKEQGRYADAEPLLREALEMRKRLFKGDHLDTAVTLGNLGLLYWAQGKYADAEPLFKDALEMAKRLFKGDHPNVALGLNNLGFLYKSQGKYADAELLLTDALEMHKRLFKGDHPTVTVGLSNFAGLYWSQGKYADAERLLKDALKMSKRLFKGDHPEVAAGLCNLALLSMSQGKYADAEPLFKDSLEMRKRLHNGDYPETATGLNNLAHLSVLQGKYADAEPLFKDALAMRKRLFRGDHPDVAGSLNNLAALYHSQDKLTDAEPLSKDALAMRERLFKGDHPDAANSLSNLANLYRSQGRYADAEELHKRALEMRKRLFKGDHPTVATSLSSLAALHWSRGKYADAEPLLNCALEMRNRLYKGDHPDVAANLSNLAALYRSRGTFADAEPIYTGALGMYRRLTTRYAKEKSEGEALTLFVSLPAVRDGFLSNELARGADPAAVYPQLWADKGFIARVYEQRQQQARAATDPKAAKALAELADARRHRAELLFAPATTDPATLAKRNEDIRTYEDRILELTKALGPLLPVLERAEKLAVAEPSELQEVLPSDVAVVDFLRFVRFEQDKDKPGTAGETRTERYLAFVVTKDKIAWVDLDTAEKIEPAIAGWRDAITSGKGILPTVPAKVRELVWEKVRGQLPTGIKTVYICPDQALCKVPFAALPGDKPNTILLEDFALATIPHAPFLLDKLLPQDPLKNPPTSALVVGAVRYDAELAPTTPTATSPGPLVKPDAKLGWSFLANTVREANGVVTLAERKKMNPTRIEGEKATSTAVLSALPKAKYAHFATHGFFADESFRSVFQLDPKDYEQSLRGERIGRAANSPLVMTGLVFAGANNPKTPGRGVLTGEQLIDLDLSGLELAVLSACETGIGDVAGGEGTFGLQRAFHYAGTTNVVASLWKVPDASTAALMALFYRNLWDKNLSPMESLRQAQLEIYRNPAKIPELAKGFRGTFEEVPGTGGEVEIKPVGGKAHPLLWAAFTLSGPGR